MITQLQKRLRLPSPAMVVALVALVFAMTGYAAAQVLPNPLPLQGSATTVVRTATTTGSPSQYASANVFCRQGERAVGGGTSSQSSGLHVWDNRPVTSNNGSTVDGQTAIGWAGSIAEADGSSGGTVTVHVVCEK